MGAHPLFSLPPSRGKARMGVAPPLTLTPLYPPLTLSLSKGRVPSSFPRRRESIAPHNQSVEASLVGAHPFFSLPPSRGKARMGAPPHKTKKPRLKGTGQNRGATLISRKSGTLNHAPTNQDAKAVTGPPDGWWEPQTAPHANETTSSSDGVHSLLRPWRRLPPTPAL